MIHVSSYDCRNVKMKRTAQALLAVVALILVAADPPSNQKLVPQDDPANIAALNRIPGVRVSVSRRDGRIFIKLYDSAVDMGSVIPWLERLHNVRGLDASWAANDDLLKCIKNWPQLQSLDLSISRLVTDKGLCNLRGLNNLTSLNLCSTSIGDSGLKHIATLKALVDLDITQTKVTDTGIRQLTALKALERLKLGRTHLSDKGLESVGRLENLKDLALYSTPISDVGIGNLSRLHNLEVLSLSDTNISDVGVAKLKSLQHLRLLLITGGLATEEVLKHFDLTKGLNIIGLRTKADLMNLDDLADVAALRATGVLIETNDLRNVTRVDARKSGGSRGDWLPKLNNLHSLTSLELPRQITDDDLVRVCELNSLKTLKIDQAVITDAGTKDIGCLTNLKELSFEYCQGVSDVTAARLSRLVKLETLDLSNSGVTDVGLKQIAALHTLRRLDLSGMRITDAGLAPIANLDSLQELILNNTQVSDVCLIHLVGLKKLSCLFISQTAITDDGVSRIRKTMLKLRVFPEHPNQ